MKRSRMKHILDEMALALVGSPICDSCGTVGEGCKEEYQCHFLSKQRSDASDSIIDGHEAKRLALKWQERKT